MHFNGLSDQEALKSREQHGSNVIPDSEPTTFWAEFKETFGDPMIRILLAIAVLMIVMWALGYADIYEPVGTIVAVLIVAFVSAKTGVASDTKYRELKDSAKKDQCKVYRNGVISVIDVDDVVVGDKVLLQSGDKIPADGVLVEKAKAANEKANPEIRTFTGRVASGDQFISSAEAKERIVSMFHPLCTEMEGAGIAQAAYLNKVSYVIIRAISDKADNSAVMDYPEFERQAITHSVRLMKELVTLL